MSWNIDEIFTVKNIDESFTVDAPLNEPIMTLVLDWNSQFLSLALYQSLELKTQPCQSVRARKKPPWSCHQNSSFLTRGNVRVSNFASYKPKAMAIAIGMLRLWHWAFAKPNIVK